MRKKNKMILLTISILMISMVLTGCLPGDGRSSSSDPAGFFSGVWHGWLAPISLIISLFKENIRVYEVINTGWWYDFGFYIAIISGFGGLSLSRKNKKSE